MDSNQSQNQKPEEINNTSSPEQAEQSELTPQDLNEVQGGKITFNPFSITKKIDVASPKLYE
jgi:type VI protein secretion system component Hcp